MDSRGAQAETEKIINVLCAINTLTEDILMDKREVCSAAETWHSLQGCPGFYWEFTIFAPHAHWIAQIGMQAMYGN